MNDAFEALKTAVVILIGIVVGILAYLGKRTSERVDDLKETAITRKELTETLAQMREDRMAQHQENREYLQRIENKIDTNEDRASRTRHDTNASVHALTVQVAVLARKGDERGS